MRRKKKELLAELEVTKMEKVVMPVEEEMLAAPGAIRLVVEMAEMTGTTFGMLQAEARRTRKRRSRYNRYQCVRSIVLTICRKNAWEEFEEEEKKREEEEKKAAEEEAAANGDTAAASGEADPIDGLSSRINALCIG